MDAQQPPHQHLAAMPVDIDGQQQQQQQQQQLQHTNPHFTMPAPVEHRPPMASGFATHSPPMHASLHALSSMYGQHQGNIAQPSMFQGNTSATMGMPMGLDPSAGLDPPRVPGGVRQPHMSVWPEATPVQAADAWSDYVPLNHHQYWELVRSARAQGGGAYNRVRDLLRQYDANGALGAFNYLHQLKMSWSDPHRAETQSQARRARDFGREARNSGMRNPSRMDPLERWLEYWHQYPDTLPVYLPIPPQLGRPTRDHTRGHILLRALIPKLKGTQQSAERMRFLEVTAQLFLIPGLYRRIVDEGHYSEGTEERLLPYPGQVTNVSIFDLAAWYAHCRLSAASIALMQPLTVRMRQFYERRDPNSGEAFLQWPLTMVEVTAVPTLAELALQVAALQENPGATTGHATAPPPLVIEGVDVDATMGEAQGVGEGQADEPGPSEEIIDQITTSSLTTTSQLCLIHWDVLSWTYLAGTLCSKEQEPSGGGARCIAADTEVWPAFVGMCLGEIAIFTLTFMKWYQERLASMRISVRTQALLHGLQYCLVPGALAYLLVKDGIIHILDDIERAYTMVDVVKG
ncbi:hypothetical protein BD310DRAFT_970484 [Dichomitus squalens]|uniref:Uncharacterized protein n=1 Tax=Dichomitus squalens TaxID=114155 RepID=A0A4Q9PFT0_9APHY|nr:hypothetical protein BD310DRAFT_970484 [Dichomitus squalens]